MTATVYPIDCHPKFKDYLPAVRLGPRERIKLLAEELSEWWSQVAAIDREQHEFMEQIKHLRVKANALCDNRKQVLSTINNIEREREDLYRSITSNGFWGPL